jgi:hypothetical protein
VSTAVPVTGTAAPLPNVNYRSAVVIVPVRIVSALPPVPLPSGPATTNIGMPI